MSSQPVQSPVETSGDQSAQPQEISHPPYMLIWFVLAVLMLAKVGYAFLDLPKIWLTTGLVIIAFWKAALVTLFYMHLRWEPWRLWVLALSPLPLAAILILVVLMEY